MKKGQKTGKTTCTNMHDVENLIARYQENTPLYCYTFGKRATLTDCKKCVNFKKY